MKTATKSTIALTMMAASQLAGTAAMAQDNRWTGLYIGAHVGHAWASTNTTSVDANSSFPSGYAFNERKLDGTNGGVHAGFNYQIGKLVTGIEGDYSWGKIDGRSSDNSPLVAGRTSEGRTEIDGLGTLAARLGIVLGGNVLLYGKAGGAWARAVSEGPTLNPNGTVFASNFNSTTRQGWLIGAGAEWAFTNNLSLRLEYDFIDFGDRLNGSTGFLADGTAFGPLLRNTELDLHTVKLGLTYRFGDRGHAESSLK